MEISQKKLGNLRNLRCFFLLLNQSLVFLCACFKIKFGFSQHVTHLSENRSLFFEIKRFYEIAEIEVYVRQLPETPKTR